jgi:hypothetical protein
MNQTQNTQSQMRKPRWITEEEEYAWWLRQEIKRKQEEVAELEAKLRGEELTWWECLCAIISCRLFLSYDKDE